jgi:uncharacterized protein YjbI with pentapeptide repeats
VAEGFTCEVYGDYRSACEGLDFYGEHGGKRYCVLHFPGDEKIDDFEEILENKLADKDYDFSGTVFPEGTANFDRVEFDANTSFVGAAFFGRVSFSDAEFNGERTDFRGAQFSGESTDFSGAQFSGGWADFLGTQFSGESTDFSVAQFSGKAIWFSGAQFSGESTDFSGARFSGESADFRSAEFNSGAGTTFQEARFAKKVDFQEATFRERVVFWGSEKNRVFDPHAWVQFHGSRIEKPEFFIFNTVRLHPGWFVNADVRKVEFTDVKWYGIPGEPEGTLDEEIAALEERGIESPHTLLSQACQRLSANAEDNRDYPLANEFHYWSLDSLRKGNWRRFGLIRTMYWALSGYGVRARRAFLVLLAIWAAFAILYGFVDPPEFERFGQGINYIWQAAVYSLLALVRLNPEPRPDLPGILQFLVGLEGLLGPLQIGLLLLAIRRTVMR